ncbi:alpha/beta fold hydrolase [Porphyrobacter sp. AAP60]|uniref:alpha/beta fold hydrolase n=1 Tax=Porphyrobacter sp. AAP60 TaxID=1523423 RepID=UPI0006B89CE4|nr:alpha/beta hydrolase [Porphyrobacter sp. AAP60]KPF64629.1 hypothetical protein IP79_04250 [Porphyrobacter sp. AAP60]
MRLATRSPQNDSVWHGEVAVQGGTLPIAMACEVDGEAPPVILLHGWTLDRRMWQSQIAALSQQFFCVMPDRRGCGAATAPADLAQEADDVIAIADFLGFERFALVGLSQGAVVALDAARKFASRVTGVVVSGAPLPGLVERDEPLDLERYRTLAEAGDMAALRSQWSRHPLMQTHSPEARKLLSAMLADYDGRDLQSPSAPPGLPDEALRALAVPVLALAGEHDTAWRRACAKALARAAPRGRYGLIEGAGHLASADNPLRFNRLVCQFLRTCTDSK